MSEKPVIFISHSSKDGAIANTLKEQIEMVLDVEVFETSHFEAIEGGEEWFEVITRKLDEATALFVLVSFNSLYSAWVHWEIGYFHKRTMSETIDLPIFVGTVAGQNPFPTISNKQAKSLNNADELEVLLKSISRHFEQDISSNLWQPVITEIMQITPVHISNESAKEKLRDFLTQDYVSGRWIDYAELEQKMGFAFGTVKVLIQELVLEYKDNSTLSYFFEVKKEAETGIRLFSSVRIQFMKMPDGWDDYH